MDFHQHHNHDRRFYSIRCQNQIYIRVKNLTSQSVHILWINYVGDFVKYSNLKHNHFVDINTYETHPWIAVDAQTKNRLLIDKKFVYLPKPLPESEQNCNLIENRSLPPRLPIFITTPLLSLRYRALLEVRSHLKSVDDICELDLPKELAHDLKLLIKDRERCIFI